MVENKNILILGGTGTLGTALIKKLYGKNRITVLSRNEHKHQEMKREYPQVKFVLGDIRDYESIESHFQNQEVIFHVAAFKMLDHLELNPLECIKTNIIGSQNVAKAAMYWGVPFVMFSSTDKAVSPINTYGFCKATSEKLFLHYNKSQSKTLFSVYRWGNVCASQGSAIPFFVNCLKNGLEVPITNREMTRFWIRIEDAVDFIVSSFMKDEVRDNVQIPKGMKSAKVLDIVHALSKLLNIKGYKTKIVGLRPGEKIHELLDINYSSKTAPKYSEEELFNLLKGSY